jgi:hypothetical protein
MIAQGVSLYDISNSSAPKLAGSADIPGSSLQIAPGPNEQVLVAGSMAGFEVVDLLDNQIFVPMLFR